MCRVEETSREEAEKQQELREHLEKVDSDTLKLDALRKAIPSHCFEKSLTRSVAWLGFDFANVLLSLALHVAFTELELWRLPQVLGSIFFWCWGGFFMWGLFVVGHDCGHQTFSKHKMANDFFGLLTHGFLSVPFFPWALSHFRHHSKHNHYKDDYSHAWSKPGKGWFCGSLKPMRLVLPVIGWQLYLAGIPDGCHWFPNPFGRLHKASTATLKQAGEAVLSTAVVVGYWLLFVRVFGSLRGVAYFYLPSVLVFGWWLVCVTYLQHHVDRKASKGLGPDGRGWDTKLYDGNAKDKGTWKYTFAAFETIDRTYGFWGLPIDWLHHRISDCHVVHHLFFKQIPHYHLREATDALVPYMEKHHAGLYKHLPTPNFATEIFRMMYEHAFDGDLISRKTIAEGGPYDPAFDKKHT